MIREIWYLALLVALLLGGDNFIARAGEPPANDPPGVDSSIKPDELTVFMAEAQEIGPWPETVIHDVMDKAGIPNMDWLREQDTGLKICRRTYVYINDKAAGGVTPSAKSAAAAAVLDIAGLNKQGIIPLHLDATKPFVCARLGMMTPQLAPGSKWWNYKIACPQRYVDDKGRTKFTEADCPSDCHCIDEPIGL